ncbi:restriction endonuclease subunit S [Eggerthellaceae bacterium zg-887]|uniref:restriction endonuclease subunit S n=1 Tax=Xiamenia xianingshaonis TaxID=2682776 RepID=UPI00140DF7D6|nr:restriction endonuclease subunit S [Xiamenia xianingshaonis]NHM16632.1 restriction endonuclease subunit S [Xiamenia xianingshaonis]
MASNYRKLGGYIREIDRRNTENRQDNLLGLSVAKCFIPSIANTVGTDFRKYKVVEKGQFAYIPDTSRRGDKIAIALLKDWDGGLVSNVYTVFEVVGDGLLPEYLELWFRRPEFDRYARFKSHGSVREIFDWSQLCDVELPVPSILEQQRIVDSFNAIERRIGSLQQLNDKLAAAGVASVRRATGDITMIGMSLNDVHDVIMPVGCYPAKVADFCDYTKSGSTPSRKNNAYWVDASVPWLKSGEVDNNVTVSTEERINEVAVSQTATKLLPRGTVLMAMYGVTAGKVGYLDIDSCTNQAICGMFCSDPDKAAFLYYSLLRDQEEISRLANGGAQNNLSKELIDNTFIVVPETSVIVRAGFRALLDSTRANYGEITLLENVRSVLLSSLSR